MKRERWVTRREWEERRRERGEGWTRRGRRGRKVEGRRENQKISVRGEKRWDRGGKSEGEALKGAERISK